MGRKKELAKNTAILTIGKMLTKVVTFFLLPLYTSILNTEEMGTYDLMITYGTLLLPLVNWQFDQGLFRFILEHREDHEKNKTLFSTLLSACFVQGIVYTVLYLVISPFLHIESSYFLLLYIVIHVFYNFLLQFVRGLGSSVKYTVATFIVTTVTTVLNVVTLAFLHIGLKGMYVSTLTALAIATVYLIFTTRCWRYFSFSCVRRDVFQNVSSYSLPLIPNNLAWWVVNASDRTVIKHFLGLSANGIYNVANKFPNMFIEFYNILNLSWTETVSLHYEDEDRDSFLTETMMNMFNLFSCACFGITAVMPFVFKIMVVKESYHSAYEHIPILMTAMLFRVLVGLYSCIYVAQKQVKKIAATSIASAIINLGVNLILVKFIGLYAASVSTLVAFVSMFIIRYIDVNKTVKMKLSPKVVLLTVVMGTTVIGGYYSGQKLIQGAILAVVIVYSVLLNFDIIRTAVKVVKEKLHLK